MAPGILDDDNTDLMATPTATAITTANILDDDNNDLSLALVAATQTPNAIDILLGALPSDQASALQTQLSYTTGMGATTQSTMPTTSTSLYQVTSIKTLTTSTITFSATASAQSTTSVLPAPPVTQQKDAGTIAGIATGSIAGVVLILLALLYIFRLRKRRNAGHSESQSSLLGGMSSIKTLGKQDTTYPQSAWLYDPVRRNSQEDLAPSIATTPPQSTADSSESPKRAASVHDFRPRQESTTESGAAELPAISVARAVDASLLEPSNDGGPRRFSYPLRATSAPASGDIAEELVSPLLPPPKSPERQRYYACRTSIDSHLDPPPSTQLWPAAYRERIGYTSLGQQKFEVYKPSRA